MKTISTNIWMGIVHQKSVNTLTKLVTCQYNHINETNCHWSWKNLLIESHTFVVSNQQISQRMHNFGQLQHSNSYANNTSPRSSSSTIFHKMIHVRFSFGYSYIIMPFIFWAGWAAYNQSHIMCVPTGEGGGVVTRTLCDWYLWYWE